MKSLIIYAHPWEGSFNHHILGLVRDLLIAQGKEVDVIDLNKDGFNPVMTAADLRVFAKGEYADPLAKSYVERMKHSEEVVFVFPIWWYSEPAILKGFFDKILLKGHTYEQVGQEIKGMLKINKGTVLTTGTIDEQTFAYLGDPIKNVFITGTLGMVGITNVEWIHCSSVHLEDHRNDYIAKIKKHFKK